MQRCVHNSTGTYGQKYLLCKGSESSNPQQFDKYVSDEVRRYVEVLVIVGGAGIFSLFGIVTNVINMAVFIKQGFKESITVSLFSLAISDFLVVLTLLWSSISYAILLLTPPGLPFDPLSVWYITAAYPHVISCKISNWITALISLERCVCVTSPFKVKDYFTPRKTALINAGIFLIVMGGYVPVFVTYTLAPSFDKNQNRTVVSLVLAGNRFLMEDIVNSINDVILPFVNLILVLMFTFILVKDLRKSSKWRSSVLMPKKNIRQTATALQIQQANLREPSTASGKSKEFGIKSRDVTTKQAQRPIREVASCKSANSSIETRDITAKEARQPTRETSVFKLCLVITVIFLICTIPANILTIVVMVDKRWEYWGQYKNAFLVAYAFVFILESLNGGVNIFVYYSMNSKYKAGFRQLFRWGPSR